MCEARWNGVRQLLFFFGCAKGADSPICSLFLFSPSIGAIVMIKPALHLTAWQGCEEVLVLHLLTGLPSTARGNYYYCLFY